MRSDLRKRTLGPGQRKVGCRLPKLRTRVRFSSPAPYEVAGESASSCRRPQVDVRFVGVVPRRAPAPGPRGDGTGRHRVLNFDDFERRALGGPKCPFRPPSLHYRASQFPERYRAPVLSAGHGSGSYRWSVNRAGVLRPVVPSVVTAELGADRPGSSPAPERKEPPWRTRRPLCSTTPAPPTRR